MMIMKQIKSGIFFVGALLSVSPAYANDSVIFFVEAPSSMIQKVLSNGILEPFTYTFNLTSDDGLLTQVDSAKLMFGPHTNVYKDGEKISSSAPQLQSGDMTLNEQDGWNHLSYVRCRLHWEHRFWIDGQGKHDRFKLSVTSQYKSGACSVDSQAHDTGRTLSIKIKKLFDYFPPF